MKRGGQERPSTLHLSPFYQEDSLGQLKAGTPLGRVLNPDVLKIIPSTEDDASTGTYNQVTKILDLH